MGAELEPGYAPAAGVGPLLAGLLATMHERHFDMLNLVSGLPAGALTWRPGPEMNSLAGLTHHILEVETFVGRVAAGEDLRWDGENGSGLEAAGDEAELRRAIVEADTSLKAVLAVDGVEPLGLTQPGENRTIGAAIVEEFDHAAMHYGHMQLTRHLWEAAHPEHAPAYEHWR